MQSHNIRKTLENTGFSRVLWVLLKIYRYQIIYPSAMRCFRLTFQPDLCKVLNLTYLPAMRIIQLKSAFSAMRIIQYYITLTIGLKTFQHPHYVTN